MHSLPGYNFRVRQSAFDRAGDTRDSTAETPYVGTLHSPFNVSLFNNVSTFAGGSAGKISEPSVMALNATIKWDGGGTPDGTAGGGSALNTGTNWVGDTVPTTTDEALLDNSIVTTLPLTLTTTPASLVFGDLLWNSNNSSTITINTGTATGRTITLSGGSASTAAIAAGGATGDLLLMGTNATTSTLTFSGNAGVGSGQLSLLLGASGNFDVRNSGATLIIGVTIGETGGARSITKTGAGTLVLSGTTDNSYTGTTAVTGGILELGKTSTGSIDAVSGNITIGDGATTAGLDILRLAGSGGNQIADTSILTFNGTGTDAGTFRLNGQSETVGGLVSTTGAGVVEDNNATASTLTLSVNTTDRSFSGIIQNGATGTLALVKTGGATQTLSGNNTYTGGTTINAGTLRAGSTTAIGQASSATLTFGSGSTGKFQLFGFDTTVVGLNTNSTVGTPVVENGAAGTATLTDNTGSTDAFAGVLQNGSAGTFALTKTGVGTLILKGTNTYSGDTQILAGDLRFDAGGTSNNSTIRLGDTAANSTFALLTLGSGNGNNVGGVLEVRPSSSGSQGVRDVRSLATTGTNTYSGTITMNAALTLQSATGGNLLLQGGSVDVKGNVLTEDSQVINLGVGPNGADSVSNQGTVTINEVLGSSLTTGGSVVKDGSGKLILQGTSNNYTGTDPGALNSNGTTIKDGVLGIYGDGSLGLAPNIASNNVFFATSSLTSAANTPTLQDTSGNVALGATRNISIANNVTARFDSNGNTFTIAGNINGAGNLNKIGAGTLALTGGNTYTGTTTVSEGTLNAAVVGALGGTTGSITVNRGGTLLLSGDGNLNRINDTTPIVLGSATGTGTATFQRGDPTNAGTILSEGLGASRNGATVTGTTNQGLGALSLQSNATFDFGSVGVGTFTFGTFTANGNSLTIMNWTSNASALALTSGVDGTDDRLIFSGAPTDIGSINFNGTAATFILLDTGFYEVVPVPEPSTWIGAALALGAIGWTQRRRFAKRI